MLLYIVFLLPNYFLINIFPDNKYYIARYFILKMTSLATSIQTETKSLEAKAEEKNELPAKISVAKQRNFPVYENSYTLEVDNYDPETKSIRIALHNAPIEIGILCPY